MKNMTVVLLAVFLLANISSGQYSPQQRPSAEKMAKLLMQCKASLNSENFGVRRSTLYLLAKIKSSYPDVDVSAVLPSMRRLCVRDKEPIVRVQANLTAAYLTDSTLVKMIKPDSPTDAHGFYDRVQMALEQPRH
jgi:hypothetical protein